ncbi:MAG TPA: glycoside hydrolase family 2 TIM barrel-domain containing protein [Chloroflexia bacterium]|nr:glycoside hydrolase family 2 TIM barrel-domain containing protein [Chloroflexia bacterium]
MMQRDENHPRPQMTRERWIDLSGPWQFAYDDNNIGLRDGWVVKPDSFKRTINVPFAPESKASGIGETGFHPVVWYRKAFNVAPEDNTGRLLLHFGAVDYSAQVWVNGQMVVEHDGGNTPFSADITTALKPGSDEQVVVVRAEDRPFDLTQPRGKQYWEEQPRRIWYHRTTGIWQTVWLEPVPLTHISEVRWTPDLERGRLGLSIKLNTKLNQPLKLSVKLSLRGVVLADDIYRLERDELKREIALDAANTTMNSMQFLWSPRYPNLLDAELRILDGDKVVDEVLSYVGLRSTGFSNGYFMLNGRPYYLRLVLEQGYWPDTLLTPPSNEALRREVELTKELGFNGVRIHQKVEDPRFLYWCDCLGLLVWGEMANAYIFSETAVERFTREWLEVVRRDYSHPCIVTWVPFNESWGIPALATDPAQQHYVEALYHLTHALDRTRPVIGNDGWEHFASDVWGIHDYALEGSVIRERYGTQEALEKTIKYVQPHQRLIALPQAKREGEPIMLTECGGISYAPSKGERWWGYGTVSSDAAFIEKYADIIGAIADCPTISGFCYTQLTDTEQETNGLLRADRSYKLDPAAIREITRRPSRAVPNEMLTNLQVTTEVSTFQSGGSSNQ